VPSRTITTSSGIAESALWEGLRRCGLTSRRALAEFLKILKRLSRCEAVGIRLLNDDGNLPYDATIGFPERYHSPERTPSLHGESCLCLRLLTGTIRQGIAGLTPGGSFVAGTADELQHVAEPLGVPVHLSDPEAGFQTVILTALRHDEVPLGLIHCADTRPYRLTPDAVASLEETAGEIGRAMMMDAIWPPEPWVERAPEVSPRAVCPLCRRWRDATGVWYSERRRRPRVMHFTVRRARRTICPSCLPFHNTE